MTDIACPDCEGKGYTIYLMGGEPQKDPCGWCHGTGKVPSDISDYIPFGDVCRNEIGMRCQHGSHYLCGMLPGYPNLGEGLRYLGDDRYYHGILIHKDDAAIFVKRMKDHRERL
jgi:hypothetical protein